MRFQLEQLRIPVFHGAGSFADPFCVRVENEYGDVTRVRARHFIIASGSKPREHPTVPIDGKYIMTSDHIASLERFPDSMVILGAGVIGCEYATIFSKFKQTKVYLIDRAERILPFEDPDISGRCAMNFKRRDVTIHSECSLDSMQVRDGVVEYVVVDNVSRAKKTVRVERALLSIGRAPNIDGLG